MPADRPDPPLIVELGGADGAERELVGGKAVGLDRLLATGLPCPPAFCVTTEAMRLYLDALGTDALAAAHAAPDPEQRLQALAYAKDLPTELDEALAGATARLLARLPAASLLAVRSSATAEDGYARSFAGLHDTALGVTAGGVSGAIRKCWASLWSPGSCAYRSDAGSRRDLSMAVVVQALVSAEVSAVVFTGDPVTGATDHVLIHAARGLGVTLVDHQVDPTTAVVSKHDLELTRIEPGDQHVRVDARVAGGVVRSRDASPPLVLEERDCRELARLAIAAEQHLGAPVDIEAAREDRWHLLQARPITTLGVGSPPERFAARHGLA